MLTIVLALLLQAGNLEHKQIEDHCGEPPVLIASGALTKTDGGTFAISGLKLIPRPGSSLFSRFQELYKEKSPVEIWVDGGKNFYCTESESLIRDHLSSAVDFSESVFQIGDDLTIYVGENLEAWRNIHQWSGKEIVLQIRSKKRVTT